MFLLILMTMFLTAIPISKKLREAKEPKPQRKQQSFEKR